MFLETFLSITDAFWVGKLGATEMAAVTSSMFPIWTIYSILTIIPTGLVAIISRAVGAGQIDEVSRTGRQSLLFALQAGLACGVLGFITAPWLFGLMGTEEVVTRMGIAYLRIFFVGVIFFFINDTLSGIFRALGDTRAHLIFATVAITVNIFLDPLLIFGLGPFPKWGTSGASVATIFSAACGTGVALIMIRRGRLPHKLHFRLFEKLDWSLIKTIVRIGFPPAISGITFSLVYVFLNRIVAEFGTVSIAALMIGHRMESLTYLTCFGFSMAASTMVGQNLGAGKPDRAARSAWGSVGITGLFALVIAIIFLVFPRQLSAFFISDENVIATAIHYLRILALSQVFMAADIVLTGAFAGAGNTVPPMAVSIPGSIARLPLAYYLAIVAGLGVDGIWWTLTITTWIKAVALSYWFLLGKWKKTGIIHT
jgi:putative MATE family efflux protein